MSSSEKNEGRIPSKGGTHSFPTIEKTTTSTSQQTSHLQFRPLFNSRPGTYSPSLPFEKKRDVNIDSEQRERADREGYEKGFEAGRQHACRIALEAIEPSLGDFLQAYENVSAFHEHVTDTAAYQIVEMALKICGHILSKIIDTTGKDLDTIRNELKNAMANAHHISLCFHREDLNAIRELMSCFNLPWPTSEAVDIQVADDLEKGRLKAEHNGEARKDIEVLLTERIPSLLANPNVT